ncbi:unnamed protein product [marine sediment metagenome]|uniref:Uncharacterized protein n=1 Tax=marine sediment metagenome TaxID=412755 RepID=X1NBD0_9ZZZZ
MKCPKCLCDLDKTTWRPRAGHDPRMRKLLCLNCDTEWYIIALPQTLAKEEREAGETGS